MKWKELTEQERNEIADRCLDNIVADYGNTVLKSSARNEYMIERTRRILRRTVWALQKQLEQGEFQPEGFEVTFGGGRIDRVDIMEDQNKVYVKVIDYKTGNTSFDLVYLYHGLQLQLMIYLDGALRVEQKKYPDKEIIPAGVFLLQYQGSYDPGEDRCGCGSSQCRSYERTEDEWAGSGRSGACVQDGQQSWLHSCRI